MNWDEKKFVEAKKTILSEEEAILALRNAWKEVLGSFPSNETLAIIVAQTALETGRWKSMYNYNWGNVKSLPNDGHLWTMFKCSEIIKGKEIFFEPPHDQTKFKAHLSSKDGAVFHISFLNGKKYNKALQYAIKGNVEPYITELCKIGYFTASLSLYLKSMKSLNNEFLQKISKYDFSLYNIPETPEHLADTETDIPVVLNPNLTQAALDIPSEPANMVVTSDLPPKSSIHLQKPESEKSILKNLAVLVPMFAVVITFVFTLIDC